MESEIVPASSEEEQDLEEAEIAPASSEEEKEKREAAQTNEVFNGVLKLQELHGRIVERLQDRVKDDLARRILEFVEEELLVIAESLTSTPTPPPFQEHRVGGKTMSWSWLLQLKFSAEQTNYFLKLSAPQRRILLQRRAARCFRPSSSACLDRILLAVRDFYHFAEHTCRYKHLHLSTSDDLGSPPAPCAAETAGLHLVGVDRQRMKLLRWLTSPSKRLRVILILGPVGVGKTTLAMEVYRLAQDQTSDERYCFQASRGPTRNELLLRDILSKISDAATPELVSSDQSQTTTLEALVQHISERLRHKRYLILIDDMLQASDWEKIKGAFSDNKLASRILITARFGRKAWSSCSYSDVLVHEMKPLNQVDSARLLLTKAFGSVDNRLSDYVKQFFYEIVRRCKGIPLFINGMADWLREQTNSEDHVTPQILMTFEGRPLSINGIPLFGDEREERDERPAIHSEQQVPQLPTRRFEQALSASYDDLPCELRLLLLYMSMFPCGYKFEKDRLIKKLFYEGLTPEMLFGNFGYPEDAEGLFSQLVDSNVVTQSQLVDKTAITRAEANCKGNPDEGEDCQWQVRHFMQQFLASKSAEMGYGFTSATLDLAAAEETDHGDKITTKPRRLALHDSHPQLLELLKDIDLSRIRSLAVSGAVNDGIPLYRFVNLVVLDLEGWENLKDEDLLQICRSKMIFLSYLSVRYTRVSKLPPEIRELWNLRLLDVSYTEISELPFQVFELTVLKELDLRGTRIRQLSKQIVGLQASLHALLVGGRGMISPTESTTRLPEEIGRL